MAQELDAPAPAAVVKILIVDDEPDVELLVRQRFKRRTAEYDFVFARNGAEAIERLQEDKDIDVVITDINMPVMDGLTLLSKLHEAGRPLKAVILSAYGDMQNIRAAMNRGAFDFLTKPIDFQDFEITIAKTLQAVAAAREGERAREELVALHQELTIAARIQQSILPRDGFTGRKEFQLYAEMEPARTIGGDFYDYFLIDDDRLGFVIGDASGKGIPAAIYMAVSRTLIKATAMQCLAPGRCLEYANRVLLRQGEQGTFVTVFYGILDARTGELEYVIGGHNPPYVVRADGTVEAIEQPSGIVVGLLEGSEYEAGKIRLQAGDTVFLFTDGVTESMDPDEKFFGERRLKQALAASRGQCPDQMARSVLDAVEEFSAGAPQADDITVLAVRWMGL